MTFRSEEVVRHKLRPLLPISGNGIRSMVFASDTLDFRPSRSLTMIRCHRGGKRSVLQGFINSEWSNALVCAILMYLRFAVVDHNSKGLRTGKALHDVEARHSLGPLSIYASLKRPTTITAPACALHFQPSEDHDRTDQDAESRQQAGRTSDKPTSANRLLSQPKTRGTTFP